MESNRNEDVSFAQLLEIHIIQEELYKTQTTATLQNLQYSVDELTSSTRSILEAYEVTQQAIKLSVVLGKFVKFIIGLLIAYYSLIEFLHHPK